MLFSASYEINSLVLSPCGGKAVTKEASISRGFVVFEGPKHQAYMAVSTQLSRPLTYTMRKYFDQESKIAIELPEEYKLVYQGGHHDILEVT